MQVLKNDDGDFNNNAHSHWQLALTGTALCDLCALSYLIFVMTYWDSNYYNPMLSKETVKEEPQILPKSHSCDGRDRIPSCGLQL